MSSSAALYKRTLSHVQRTGSAKPATRRYVEQQLSRIFLSDMKFKNWFDGHWRRHLDRISVDLELFEALRKKDVRVLEIGCCPPMLTAALVGKGYMVDCVDLEPARFEGYLQSIDVKFIKCNIETEHLPFFDGEYDVVIINEVFEHLRINPPHTFREIKRVLSQSGVLLLSTPNLRSIEGMTNIIVHKRGYALCGEIFDEYSKIEDHGHMGHVREYTSRDVENFLRAVGFEVENVIYRGESRALGAAGRIACSVMPSLRPFMTVVARNP